MFRWMRKKRKYRPDPIDVLRKELAAKGQNMTETEVEQYLVDVVNSVAPYNVTLDQLQNTLQKMRGQGGAINA